MLGMGQLILKICRSGGRQRNTITILGLHVLVHSNQTWMFHVNEIAIKFPNAQNMG